MKKTLNQRQKQGWLTLFALVIIAFAVSIGFTPLFELIEDGIAARIIGSSFGAIFVIILTMFLLNKQTEIEQESKKSERVFDEKVKIYQKILDICSDMLMDGNLTQDEINRLPFPLIRLQMLSDDMVIETFQKVFNKLNDIYKSDLEAEVVKIQEEEKNEIYQLLSNFSSECRKDLEISNVEINEKIKNETAKTISQANSRKKNDQTKFKFNGKMLPKNQYVYSVVTNYLKENPQLTLEQFKNSVFDRNSYGRKGQWEGWKTYKEVMDLHYNGSGAHRFYVSEIAKDIEKNKDKVIKLIDEEICLANTWVIGNMKPFIDDMNVKGIRTE
jgi:hypothetical protein|tara:strand:+ start:700 stop:1686 length:987 start_codon:yes stop_codon:yes gene_type:complete